MACSLMFKIIIKQDTYDILSADTGFYAYMGDSRLYYTFNKLIYEADVQMFTEYAETLSTKNFILRMTAIDGSTIPYYVTMEQGNASGQLQLILIDIEELIVRDTELNSRFTIQGKLLELYGDDIFIYEPQTNRVRLISDYNVVPKERNLSLDEFEILLKRNTDINRFDDVTAFIAAIRNGNRYFELFVEGNIIDEHQQVKYSIIKGASIFEKGERILSTGYIHRGDGQTAGNERKIEMDSLTGLLSKAEITNMAIRAIDIEKKKNISIAIVDVDHFKRINDTYGHMKGDEVIKKVASIMEAEVGNNGAVGRIGGDEFFILFYDAYDLEDARERLRSIKNTVSAVFPMNDENMPMVTLSIGCSAYPKDADNYSDLFALADFALYRAKEKGRNRYIIYDKEKHGTLEKIQKNNKMTNRINSRGDMSYGDILCVIMDRVYRDEKYSLDKLLDDYHVNFPAQRITIYDRKRSKVLLMVGSQVPDTEIMEETQSYIKGDFWQKSYENDVVVINDIERLESRDKKTYKLMKKQGILSCIHIKFKDKNGVKCILSLESVNKKIIWSNDHMHYYRLMAKLLSQYAMV